MRLSTQSMVPTVCCLRTRRLWTLWRVFIELHSNKVTKTHLINQHSDALLQADVAEVGASFAIESKALITRDREIVHPAVLEHIGWTLAKVWQEDYFRYPEKVNNEVLEKLLYPPERSVDR